MAAGGAAEIQGRQAMREMEMGLLMSMDVDPDMFPILILPASNIFYFCHHPQPHHSRPYHTQSIIYYPSFVINGNSWYWAYSIPNISIFPIFSRLPSLLCPPFNSVKWSIPQNNSCHKRYSPIQNILLDIDHQWISDKSILPHFLPLYPFHPQVYSISIASLTPLHSSLFPLSHPLSLHSCFIDICPHVTMILSSLAYSPLTPFLFSVSH